MLKIDFSEYDLKLFFFKQIQQLLSQDNEYIYHFDITVSVKLDEKLLRISTKLFTKQPISSEDKVYYDNYFPQNRLETICKKLGLEFLKITPQKKPSGDTISYNINMKLQQLGKNFMLLKTSMPVFTPKLDSSEKESKSNFFGKNSSNKPKKESDFDVSITDLGIMIDSYAPLQKTK